MLRPTRMLVAIALVFAAAMLASAWNEPWELLHDELYYWVGAQRPMAGYVDHPPLAPWILAATQALLGEGVLGFRLVPALLGGATVFLTGRMARSYGAGAYGQVLAGLCAACAPFLAVMFSWYSVNAFDLFLWTAAAFAVAELARTGDRRLWIVLGGVAGLGLLNKHTFVLIGFALAAGVLASPLRAHLRSRWPWLGAGLALLITAPNLWWNAANGWPSLAFYASRSAANLPTNVAEAIVIQVAGSNPVALFVWVPGLAYLLFSPRGRPYRPLGIAFVALLGVMVLSGLRRGDRIAGAYPMVLAAGATFWDQGRARWQAAARFALPVLLVPMALLLAPVMLPVLSPERTAAFLSAIDEDVEIEPADVGSTLPVHLQGRLGWQRFVAHVTDAVDGLAPEERARAVILSPHWLFAVVTEYYGRGRDLPPVVAPHNAYAFWNDRAAGRDLVITLAMGPEDLAPHFAEVRPLGFFTCIHCAAWRPDMPILLGSGPRAPLEEMLRGWRHYGLSPAPALQPDLDALGGARPGR